MIDDKTFEILDELRDAYNAAVRKHPTFAVSYPHAVSLITEELGEFAKEINDEMANNAIGLTSRGWRERAFVEATHIAVTAIRTMQLLKEEMR